MQKKKGNSVSRVKSNSPISRIDVEKYKNRSDILRKTVEQIQKDFGLFGLEVYFSGDENMIYEELFEQLSLHVDTLLQNDQEKLFALLYQIDVNDRHIVKAADENPNRSHSEVIAELILYRELRKVILRFWIKENPDWLNS